MKMRLLGLYCLALVMGLAADTAHAGPDPPIGKYGIYIKNNDGTFDEVPFGQPVVYPSIQSCPMIFPAQNVWGLAVHGKVNLPNPGGAGWTWRVRCVVFYDAGEDEDAFMVYDGGGFGPHAWTGAIVGGDWSLWATPEYGVFWGMGAGSYEVWYQLEINGPGVGGWWPVPNTHAVAYFTW